MEISYKGASMEDIDVLYEANIKLIKDYEDTSKIDLARVLMWVRNKIESNINQYNSVYYGDTKVGYFRLYKEDDKYELDDLYILEKYRGLGIGSSVLNHVDGICRYNGKDVFLYVFIKNKRATDLYLRHGYKIVENIRDSRYIMVKTFK
ncbi:MAG: GNAT family N-acetyltransferase [Paraclostridium sp.]